MEPGEEQPTVIGRRLDSLLEARRQLVADYRRRVELAESIARILGGLEEIVGRVSMIEDIGVDEIPVDVPPETWVHLGHQDPQMLGEGYYYMIVDPKTMSILLASVAATVKPSAASGLPAQQQLVTVPLTAPHPLGVAGNVIPLRLVLRPILAVHLGHETAETLTSDRPGPTEAAKLLATLEPMPPTVPPDPNSPVTVPHPKVLAALLAAAQEGVLLGGLAVMDSLYLAGGEAVPIRLPWSVLVKHVLVTGTTGSGKTSLVKNMMLSASETPGVHIVVLDAGSDYAAGLLPGHIPGARVTRETAAVLRLYGAAAEPGKPLTHPGLEGLVAIPCPGCGSPGDYAREAESYVEYLGDALAKSYSKLGCRLQLSRPTPSRLQGVYTVTARLECGNGSQEVSQKLHIAPRKILLNTVADVARLDPYLTARAREALRLLATACNTRTIDDALNRLSHPGDCSPARTIHQETRRNLEARLRALKEMNIIGWRSQDPGWADLNYHNLAQAMEQLGAYTLVLDLGYAAHTTPGAADPESVKVLLGYRLLQTLAAHMEAARETPAYAMLVIDEAHLFFPPGARDYAQLLRSSIERLARLGRSRGISIVFSTHRETDVSPVIATLANTKIYMRTDRRTAEETYLPQEYRRRLPQYRDHAAVAATYAARGGYLPLKNAPPLIGHRTA